MSEKKVYQKLPAVLQTTAIKNFFESTVEQLFSKANVDSIQGYIGSPSSDDVNVSGKFLAEPTTIKKFYGLSPAVNTINTTTGKSENLFFYDELVETLQTYGVNTLNHNKIFSEKYSSFLPPINIDKFINYQEYYWYPYGPTAIAVTGTVTNYIDIDIDIIGSKEFIPNGGKAFRNGMVVKFSGDYVTPISKHDIEYIVQGVGTSITLTKQTVNLSARYTSTRYTSKNIDLVWKTAGAVTDIVTYTADQTGDAITTDVSIPEPYIAGANSPGLQKEIKTVIVGTLNRYNGSTILSDGTTTVTLNHSTTQPRNVVELVTEIQAHANYSALKFTVQVADRAPTDYIVQEKNALNNNIWSRINFWYHRNNFLDASDSLPSRSFRASRPIIEFDKSLELYNHGTQNSIADIDVVAYNFAYAELDGAPKTTLVDGLNKLNYSGLIFTNESTDVAKYVYKLTKATMSPQITASVGTGATFSITLSGKGRKSSISAITVLEGGTGYDSDTTITIADTYGTGATATATVGGGVITGVTVTAGGTGYYLDNQYRLEQLGDPSINPAGANEGDPLFKPLIASTEQTVSVIGGETHLGKEYKWSGLQWQLCQEKLVNNQAPLFNLYSSAGTALNDVAVYPTSTFVGSKIFGYADDVPVNGTNINKSTTIDPQLGKNLVYKQYNAQSEILFENFIETESFSYTPYGTNTTTGVTLGASNTGGPYSINGYYPLYSRETLAQDAGNSTAHEHVFFGKTFYMPNGLILGTTYFHGNYNGTLTSPEYTATTTTVSSQNTTIPTTINSSTSTTGDSY
tara:strand:- start:511 stop:2910 length:2400 start_codon:yes stop_codon:yes gene_type:complete